RAVLPGLDREPRYTVLARCSVTLKLPAHMRKWSPSGRRKGHREENWLAFTCVLTKAPAPLPSALTRHIGRAESGVYRITPLLPQLPPRGALPTTARFCGAPPERANLRSLPL